ncbi:MAG: type I restriction-modification system subunit M [Deltaproteobacteria bacterium RBG_19FT_COMBO_43_11]|nr:MAG: type I restriction-modification system subunit M [Deltaproteobacteria bacterium RBG_16_44_11]OGP88350.1 MAG: type I restriction-modification system subunit M [Deltaproteobacteria bacterium RBG_19FT_COMBO_43_11]
MPIRKSELYSSLWKSCDELRGAMDAGQYKDYVLVLLFIKYVSDKYAGKKDAIIEIPNGASFKDLIKLKGQSDIGDKINKIIGKLAKANDLTGVITVADFNDEDKLGKGKDMVDRLSNLIAIFENPALDFSSNRAENDDILGDAYEYLMRHFATESGKSKGQFYTPAEVSRIMAKVIETNKAKSQSVTIYDPTCGSGSLLLKAADEAPYGITIYGQENDNATRALAVMNMWLHGNPASDIKQGNTIATPLFTDEKTGYLKTFDYVVANPPFSYKSWSNGIDPQNDVYERFKDYGIPPAKNGDYAFLLHILKSLKSKGRGACILPHGVLFRGNAEAEIRTNIIRRGYIKGIIGLPANLFYGTSIPACIIVIDKENAAARKGIFMVDASKGFIKDGNKNRLREQDIHKIVDVFNRQLEISKYSRMVNMDEIEKNEFNLNIPRYIDTQEAEDIQDIDAHLKGGIPQRDIEDLESFWSVYPSLKAELFAKGSRKGYCKLKVIKDNIKHTIFNHHEFTVYSKVMQRAFDGWKKESKRYLKQLGKGVHPKQVIYKIAEAILFSYRDVRLLNKYDVYQHLLNYWAQTMQDDLYELAADGWRAGNEVIRLVRKGKEGKKDRDIEGIDGLEGRLIPPMLMIEIYFEKEKTSIDELEAKREALKARMEELREEHGDEEGLLAEVLEEGKLNKKNLAGRIKELGKKTADNNEEWDILQQYKKLMDDESDFAGKIKRAWKELEIKVMEKYSTLAIEEIKTIVVERKWMTSIEKAVHTETDRISQRLAGRIKELAQRYESTLSELNAEIAVLGKKVNKHLQKMGFVWN